MYARRDFDPIDEGEIGDFTFDFARDDIASGETIVSAVWNCSVAESSIGADPSASSRLSGSPYITGLTTMQRVSGTVGGVKYVLQASVTTSLGNVLSLWSYVTCNVPA